MVLHGERPRHGFNSHLALERDCFGTKPEE